MLRARTVLLLMTLFTTTALLDAQAPPPLPPPSSPPLPPISDLATAHTGLFASLGLDVVRARLRDYGAPVDSLVLDYAASPRVSLGVGLGGGMALQATYRFLSSSGEEGTFKYLPYYPAFEIHPQLEMHTLDLDLLGRELDHLGLLRTQWRAGVRLGKVDMETYSVPFPGIHSRDEWTGIGGHLGPQLSLVLGNTGLAFFALGDFGLMWGSNHYNTWAFARDHGPASADPLLVPTVASESLGSIQLRGELGLSWTYCLNNFRFRATGGFGWEWWFFPALSNADGNYFDSPGTGIPMEGLFVRLEVQF